MPCRRLIFVCHGNILRSPFAAALLRRELGPRCPTLVIGSAGLHATDGRSADPRGIIAAATFGVDLAPHRAALLTAEVVRVHDILIVMDSLNEAECIAWFPEAQERLRFLGAFDPDGSRDGVEIADPYSLDSSAVTQCYEDMARCISGLRAVLERDLPLPYPVPESR